MSDENKPSLDRLIKSWLVEVGEEKMTKANVPYWHIDFANYPEALNSLLQTFLKNGYGEEDVDAAVTLRKIQEAMTPEVHDTHKLNDWKNIIGSIWKHYTAREFADTSLVAPPKNYPKINRKPKLEVVDSDAPPKVISKLDPKTFQGYCHTEPEIDEEFVKMLEALKDE